MQTVPSLVGTGTAIAAAASGLVFGQLTDQNQKLDCIFPTTTRTAPQGHTRTISVDRALPTHLASPTRAATLPSRRPATSTAAPHSRLAGPELHAVTGAVYHYTSRPLSSRRHRPQKLQSSPSTTSSRHPSHVETQEDFVPDVSALEHLKNSVTWSSSWLKRLSNRPISQHGSPRSSILADSSPFTLSHGSKAPVLSTSGSVSRPLPPNKLVKRSSTRNNHLDALPARKSRAYLPILRRPATSHQRLVDIQQQSRPNIEAAGLRTHPKYSFDEPIRPEELLGASPIENSDQSPQTYRATRSLSWGSFIHFKIRESGAKSDSKGRVSSGGGDVPFGRRCAASKRAGLVNPTTLIPGAHLVKPRMVSNSSTVAGSLASSHLEEAGARVVMGQKNHVDSPLRAEVASEEALSAPPRRSFSSSFSHTGNWALKTTGSLRRTKRGAHLGDSDSKRHVSAPVSTVGRVDSAAAKPSIALIHQGSTSDTAATLLPHLGGKRSSTSSPLAPLSKRSGVGGGGADSSRLTSLSAGGASHSIRPSQPSGSSTSSAGLVMSQRGGSHLEKSSALDSSDGEGRDPNSGDEDDTDFKSDALFDSLRTLGSGPARVVDTPLESVYDESPPSTGGNKKLKRLSIQEILDHTWNEDSRIMEEDENNATPSRVAQRLALAKPVKRERKDDTRFGLEHSSYGPHQITHDLGRFSLDDNDFDEDWTRDEEDALYDALSPPSKVHALNSPSAVNPNVRLALANIGDNSAPPSSHPCPPRTERSLGNLFDWSEPPTHDKQSSLVGALRPQTAYGKQQGDSRGGRSAVRKRLVPTHVRSQSVPVVHDGAEDAKPTGLKYGTWGLGTKTVSEDWDEDFEFGGDNNGPDGKENHHHFAVPESIRASQPSVKAHSGQIRELSLLVNDLKRLCRHGRELDMLTGDEKPVWKEAEGIIALASPDEDADADDDNHSGSSVYVDAFEANGSPVDEQNADLPPFDLLDAVMEHSEPFMSKTAVVRERQSPRRRSVISAEDDIFGANWPLVDERSRSNHPSRPRTPENQPSRAQDVNVVVRSVVETMENRPVASDNVSNVERTRKSYNATDRMQFDTNSLKALVKRAGELRDILSEVVRKADQLTQSPICTPRHDRCLDSSPAFTRVFDDPGSSPPVRPTKTRVNSSTCVECASPDNTPGRRVPLMTVS